jgi:hypothetical protein
VSTSATGTIGTCASRARLKAPKRNGSNREPSERVPSGNISTMRPSSMSRRSTRYDWSRSSGSISTAPPARCSQDRSTPRNAFLLVGMYSFSPQ